MTATPEPVVCRICGPSTETEDVCLRCGLLWLIGPECEEWIERGDGKRATFDRLWNGFVERTRIELRGRVACAGCGSLVRELHAGVPLCVRCRDRLGRGA